MPSRTICIYVCKFNLIASLTASIRVCMNTTHVYVPICYAVFLVVEFLKLCQKWRSPGEFSLMNKCNRRRLTTPLGNLFLAKRQVENKFRSWKIGSLFKNRSSARIRALDKECQMTAFVHAHDAL